MGLSIRAYAKHRGVSDRAVRKALESGRIEKDEQGLIDPEKADTAWEKHTDPAMQRQSNPNQAYQQARAMDMVNKAKLGKLQVAALEEKLIDKEKATRLTFELARQFRDSWITWPTRISAQLASECGADPHKLHVGLEKYVREQLEEIKNLNINFN